MKHSKTIASAVVLPFLLVGLGGCGNSSRNPETSYEKIVFAISNAIAALEKPSLKESPSTKETRKARGYADILADVKALTAETDRSLENSFNLDSMKFAKLLFSGVGPDFTEGTVYSASKSGILSFDFDRFSGEGSKTVDYAYTLTARVSAELSAEGVVTTKAGFSISLPEGHSLYSYATIKLSSSFDASSNDFSMDLKHYEDYFDVPTGTGFCSYEEEKAQVETGLVSSFDDFFYQADRRILLDATSPQWQNYLDQGTKFLPGAKIFDGDKVYKSTEERDEKTNAVLRVYKKNEFMPFFVDELGLNSTDLSDKDFFAKETTSSAEAKTAIDEMETASQSFVGVLLGNLENTATNLDAESFDSIPKEDAAIASLRILDASSRKEIAAGFFVDQQFTIADLLTGKIAVYGETSAQPSFALCLEAGYSDGTSKDLVLASDLAELAYQRNDAKAISGDNFFILDGWDGSSSLNSTLKVSSSDGAVSVSFEGSLLAGATAK